MRPSPIWAIDYSLLCHTSRTYCSPTPQALSDSNECNWMRFDPSPIWAIYYSLLCHTSRTFLPLISSPTKNLGGTAKCTARIPPPPASVRPSVAATGSPSKAIRMLLPLFIPFFFRSDSNDWTSMSPFHSYPCLWHKMPNIQSACHQRNSSVFFSALETLPKLAFPKTLKMALPMAVKSCDCEISGATALNFFVSATHVSTRLYNFSLALNTRAIFSIYSM